MVWVLLRIEMIDDIGNLMKFWIHINWAIFKHKMCGGSDLTMI